MSRNLSGEASNEENEELIKLLHGQSELQQQYTILKQAWNINQSVESKPEPGKISRILQLAAVQEALKEEVVTEAPVIKWKRVYKWAAVFAGVLISLWAVNKWVINKTVDNGKVIAHKGTKTRTILPDGSTVWLNAGSRIEYLPGFTDKTREVTLYGEAYFDIIKQPDRPFIVHAGGINIRVLGTAFNVKSYPDEKTIETTLIRGLVQITRTNDTKQEPIYLHPHQKIVLPVSNNEVQSTQTAPVKNETGATPEKLNTLPAVSYLDSSKNEAEYTETAWIYNRLLFRGDNFEDLAKKMERWYNISIQFEDEQAKKLTFNGSIENETVEQAFHALKTAVPFNFKIKNNEVFISTKQP